MDWHLKTYNDGYAIRPNQTNNPIKHQSFVYTHLNDQANRAIGLMSRVFANGPGDRGSISGRIIPKTQKMVLDASLLNTAL